jgi:branched-chain amino acid transport system substrate-binding protein
MTSRLMKMASFLLIVCLFVTACASKSATPASTTAATGDATKAPASKKDPIIIGSSMAMTGGAGYLGTDMKEVFDLIIKQTNEKGGINGHELKLINYDDENKPEKAVQNVQKLIKKDGAKVILGPSTAATSAAAQPVVDKEKSVMFSLSTAYMPPANSYAFNVGPTQATMHQLHQQWFVDKGIKKVGMIASTDSSGNISVDIIKNQYNKKDGVEYVIERMGLDTVDVTPQLTRLKSAGIQALVIIGPGAPPIIAIKNAGQLGMNIPILLTHSQASKAFADSLKGFVPAQLYVAATAGMAYKDMNEKNPIKPILLGFADDFKKEYSKDIDHVRAIGYDSIMMVVKALQDVGSDDPEKIKTYFETKVNKLMLTTSITSYTPDNHNGSSLAGAVLLKLDPDQSWHINWEPKFWE